MPPKPRELSQENQRNDVAATFFPKSGGCVFAFTFCQRYLSNNVANVSTPSLTSPTLCIFFHAAFNVILFVQLGKVLLTLSLYRFHA